MKKTLWFLMAATLLPACGGGGGGGDDPAPPPVFGTNGVIVSDPTPSTDTPFCIVAQDGFLYVGGYSNAGPGDNQWRIEKRATATGAFDTAFGTAGAVTENPSAGPDQVSAMAVDTTHMYLAGYDLQNGGLDYQWRLEKRTLATGAFDPVFGAAGVVLINPSAGIDVPKAIVIDADAMYVCGYDSVNTNRQWRVEKRNLSDGALVAAFATAGVYTFNPSASDEDALCMVLTGSSLIVAGTIYLGASDTGYRLEKLNTTTGAVDAAFTTTHNPSAGLDSPFGIAVSGTDFFVVGLDATPGMMQWKIDRRAVVNAVLFQEVFFDPSAASDTARVIIASGMDIYVGGDDFTPGTSGQVRIQKRVGATLALDTTFGVNGNFTDDPSTGGAEYVVGIAQDTTSLYVLSGDSSAGQPAWRIRKISK